eukprot:TRINITY_DN5096_c0_g1_i1.p1 TRINITY_DN5096_c0_g1~~TRINITY_DN5096_c0_g1_i1.p1  ORF type:complete len:257 (-),score=18.55 TRINITY_DN5096_c0_g1_i1:108-878(-)
MEQKRAFPRLTRLISKDKLLASVEWSSWIFVVLLQMILSFHASFDNFRSPEVAEAKINATFTPREKELIFRYFFHYFQEDRVVFVIHNTGAVVWGILGPIQLLGFVKRRYLSIHRWMGRLSVIAALNVIWTGVILSIKTKFGYHISFSMIVYFPYFLLSILLTYNYARNHKVQLHRKWALRSFVLGFVPPLQRVFMIILMSYWSKVFLAPGATDETYILSFSLSFWLAVVFGFFFSQVIVEWPGSSQKSIQNKKKK